MLLKVLKTVPVSFYSEPSFLCPLNYFNNARDTFPPLEKDRKISRTQEKLIKLSRDGAGEDGDISLVRSRNLPKFLEV